MNKQPIEKARDADLRLSSQALQRAAQRARELARQTGTAIVVSRRGVIETIRPDAGTPGVQEPAAPCGKAP
ncbi:hypothetical protein [Zoogloea sp.]|uniref:hypothetical protein n=1 Tax=Zoogloea sp. TaxID=49181 RepID=UPI0035B2CFE1